MDDIFQFIEVHKNSINDGKQTSERSRVISYMPSVSYKRQIV